MRPYIDTLVTNPVIESIEIFHETTKLFPENIQDFYRCVAWYSSTLSGHYQVANAYKQYTDSRKIYLPKSTKPTTGIDDVLSRRRSVRNFTYFQVSTQLLANVLNGSLGTTQVSTSTLSEDIKFEYRPYPAAGGIFSIEHYVFLLSADELEMGIYHYEPRSRCLTWIKPIIDINQLHLATTLPYSILTNAAFIILQTSVFSRVVNKYRERGYRFSLIEVGLATQTICLVSQSHGLGTLVWGGFREMLIDQMLGLDTTEETGINLIVVGLPADDEKDV